MKTKEVSMANVNKTYIMIGAAGGYISGAPIYHRNKALYMQESGWSVYYISVRDGKIFVSGLEKFIIGCFPILEVAPFLLKASERARVLKSICSKIPSLGDEIVIETGTFYTAYWGELLAKELGARHTIVYLDEHNSGINGQTAKFFKFKYDRFELACISQAAYQDIFAPFWTLDSCYAVVLSCYCTNSLEDISSPITKEIKCADITIGYVGRLEKDAFKVLIEEICQFSIDYPQFTIALNCFGDFDSKEERMNLLQHLSSYNKITLYISGFIFPIPVKAITKCNICFGSAGSAFVPVKANVPTVEINVYTNKPDGFKISVKESKYTKISKGESIYDYLKAFFVDRFRPQNDFYDLSEDKLLMHKHFQYHISFLEKAQQIPTRYFDFSMINLSSKEKMKKLFLVLFGYRMLKQVKKAKHALCLRR